VVNNLIAIEPKVNPLHVAAIESGGAKLAPLGPDVRGLIWTDYKDPDGLASQIKGNPQLEWVQLPFAGVDAFASILDAPVLFTSAKGSYREPVAEHALALALALGRKLPIRIRATSWGEREAITLYDTDVVLVGGGGISEELVKLLAPFRAKITVVRNKTTEPFAGADKVVGLDQIGAVVATADLVIIATALTEQTRGLFDYELISKMKRTAFLVNVARGPIVIGDDLLRALDEGLIHSAALDVTDPEPLPDGHRMFGRDDLIITPHSADDDEMVARLLAVRITLNVKAFLGLGEWVGVVDPKLGY
jgi:phosphoglycerate dehydrogenase-like enzyme